MNYCTIKLFSPKKKETMNMVYIYIDIDIDIDTHTHTHTNIYAYVCLQCGIPGLIPGLGRSPEEGTGYPLQYSCLENSRDRGAWPAAVYGVTKSRTRLSN